MKSPPVNGSSGSSIGGLKVASHSTGSGVKKSSTGTKKVGKVVHATRGESPQEERKWQAFVDSARGVSADNETVWAGPDHNLKEKQFEKEAEKFSYKKPRERPGYDVKGLMAQIYEDLHTVAAAQASKVIFGEAPTERLCLGELSESDLSLREISVGVASVISKSLHSPSTSASTNTNPSTESALALLYNPENPQSSEIWDIDEKMARSLSHDHPVYERYGRLAANPGWKFLSKLAHSAAFRDAACTLEESTWQIVSTSIYENIVSLTVFVECCGLNWWTELIHLNSLFPPTFDFTKYQSAKPKKYSPHKWVVTEKLEDIKRPTFEGKRQVNIGTNIYRREAFKASPRPIHWPADRPYPEDPTKVRDTSLLSCISCQSHTPCTCSFLTSPDIWHPHVELRDYGAKGVGVRALEWIPARAILAEYVGEVFPANYNGDPVYALDFSLPGRGTDEVIASISSKRFGNWTRFINHSCDAATKFRTVTQGGRHRSVVQAVRDIEVFEEVTVNYGDGYWRNRTCECGAEGCFSRTKGKDVGPELWDLSTVVYEVLPTVGG